MKEREKRTRLEHGTTMDQPEKFMRRFYSLLSKLVQDNKEIKESVQKINLKGQYIDHDDKFEETINDSKLSDSPNK